MTVLNDTPVASLASVTVAPGTTAPLWSVTTPSTRDVVPCAAAETVETRKMMKASAAHLRTISTSQTRTVSMTRCA